MRAGQLRPQRGGERGQRLVLRQPLCQPLAAEAEHRRRPLDGVPAGKLPGAVVVAVLAPPLLQLDEGGRGGRRPHLHGVGELLLLGLAETRRAVPDHRGLGLAEPEDETEVDVPGAVLPGVLADGNGGGARPAHHAPVHGELLPEPRHLPDHAALYDVQTLLGTHADTPHPRSRTPG